jgi:hypothetical protein
VDWIKLAQDKDQWQIPLNTVMNLWAPEKQDSIDQMSDC